MRPRTRDLFGSSTGVGQVLFKGHDARRHRARGRGRLSRRASTSEPRDRCSGVGWGRRRWRSLAGGAPRRNHTAARPGRSGPGPAPLGHRDGCAAARPGCTKSSARSSTSSFRARQWILGRAWRNSKTLHTAEVPPAARLVRLEAIVPADAGRAGQHEPHLILPLASHRLAPVANAWDTRYGRSGSRRPRREAPAFGRPATRAGDGAFGGARGARARSQATSSGNKYYFEEGFTAEAGSGA